MITLVHLAEHVLIACFNALCKKLLITALSATLSACCHKYLNDKISAESLSFVTEHPHLKGKLCEAITDAIRTARISAAGYKVSALELTDPENTPKNTLIAAIKNEGVKETELARRRERYDAILDFVLGDKKDSYLSEIK